MNTKIVPHRRKHRDPHRFPGVQAWGRDFRQRLLQQLAHDRYVLLHGVPDQGAWETIIELRQQAIVFLNNRHARRGLLIARGPAFNLGRMT